MFSRLLAVPFMVLMGLFFLLAAFTKNANYALYAVPMVVLMAIIYVFSPQLDWWWYNRNPPEMEPPLRRFLEKFSKYYASLAAIPQKRFRHRVNMYLMANEFIPKAMEVVPEDIQGLIASNIVQLTFGQEDYRLPMFERIVLYPHPFPSPQYPEHLHSCEIFKEDGVIIFSAEQLLLGATQSQKYYNIALHEFAKIFVMSYPDHPYPHFDVSVWPSLERISNMKPAWIQDYVGLPVLGPLPVSIVFFFTFPQRFQQELPDIFDLYQTIFNQNPLQTDFPVIDGRKQGTGI